MSSESGIPRSLFGNMLPLLSLKRKLTRPPGLGEEGVLKGKSLRVKGTGVVETVIGLVGVLAAIYDEHSDRLHEHLIRKSRNQSSVSLYGRIDVKDEFSLGANISKSPINGP